MCLATKQSLRTAQALPGNGVGSVFFVKFHPVHREFLDAVPLSQYHPRSELGE